jgi:hypothetical protein
MITADADARPPELSVVIPSFNSAQWLPSTLDALAAAVARSRRAVEVIVVDDGSTDDTAIIVGHAAREFPGRVELVRQQNRGRFMARWAGLQRAAADLVLLLDSRVMIHEDALRHVIDAIDGELQPPAWNGHIITDPKAPLIGLFWEVPTHVFWGRYLRAPRVVDIDSRSFDTVPKGTTMFLARRNVLIEAFRHSWPKADAKLVSDDTKVLRWIAENHHIRIDPRFSATYRPRTQMRKFLAHTLDRGTLFVDSYAGTTRARSAVLIALVFAPLALAGVIVATWSSGARTAASGIAAAAVAGAAAPAVIAAVNRCSPRGVLAYVIVLPAFGVPFWLGLARGVFIHRAAFIRSSAPALAAARKADL